MRCPRPYPPSFGADVDAYLAHLAGGDLFDETGPNPASPLTLRDVRFRLFQMAAALVHSGRAPDLICTLADIVEPEATKIALNFFWLRKGKRKTGQIHNFALAAIKIAKWWVKAPPEWIAALQAIRRLVDPNERGMTARNRARLRQFDDPENLRRLIDLPDAILRALPRSTAPSFDQALRVQSALAIAILTIAPMRMRNLSSLCLGRHVVQTRAGGVRHIIIPSEEVKNGTPLSFEVSEAVGDVLDVYLECYPARLAGDPMGFCFRRAPSAPRRRRNLPSRSSAQFGRRSESISTRTLFDIWPLCCFCVRTRASTKRFGCFSVTRISARPSAPIAALNKPTRSAATTLSSSVTARLEGTPMTRPTRIACWPARDRELWTSCLQPGSLFGGGGFAAIWSEATRFKTICGYTAWLRWLAAHEQLDPNLEPTDRVTKERVVASSCRRTVRPTPSCPAFANSTMRFAPWLRRAITIGWANSPGR